jgi:hypothetical protein
MDRPIEIPVRRYRGPARVPGPGSRALRAAATAIAEAQTPDTEALLAATLERAFEGDLARLVRFVAILAAPLPPDTKLFLRGSAVTGESYVEGEPFDARGPGTSDLDVVLSGADVVGLFAEDAFYYPGVNSYPLSDERRDVSPALDPARTAAQELVGRPVSVQAMSEWLLNIRAVLQGTPSLPLGRTGG